jgi:hypothetical protein
VARINNDKVSRDHHRFLGNGNSQNLALALAPVIMFASLTRAAFSAVASGCRAPLALAVGATGACALTMSVGGLGVHAAPAAPARLPAAKSWGYGGFDAGSEKTFATARAPVLAAAARFNCTVEMHCWIGYALDVGEGS